MLSVGFFVGVKPSTYPGDASARRRFREPQPEASCFGSGELIRVNRARRYGERCETAYPRDAPAQIPVADAPTPMRSARSFETRTLTPVSGSDTHGKSVGAAPPASMLRSA